MDTAGQIDSCIRDLSRIFSKANKVASSKKIENPPSEVTSLEREIEDALKEKRRLRREWQKSRSPSAKTNLKLSAKRLKKLLKQEENLKQNHLLENLSPLQSKNSTLWKLCKTVSTPIGSESPLRLESGSWARSNEEIAFTFARHLKTVFQPHNYSNTPFEFPTLTANKETIPLTIAASETKSVLSELNTKKASGYDKISPKMLRELPMLAIRIITKLFNAVIQLGYFPPAWKKSLIKMIPKPGKDKSLPTSYRPISLLPCMSKVFEKLLVSKILPMIEASNLIPNHQFGFQPHHGTIEQVNRVTSEIRKAFEQKLYCVGIFLDVAQAFDKVWHEGLIYKVKNLLPQNTHNILISYLSKRVFQVKYNSFITTDYDIKAGVPQGSVLGPLLYILYTSDFPTNPTLVTSTFADDTAILCSRPSPISASQEVALHLKIVEKWLGTWRVKINEQKSKYITFSLRPGICPALFINGVSIQHVNEVVYLGIHLDRRLTWKSHILARRLLVRQKLASFSWLLNFRSKISLQNKVIVYKSILKPVLLYGIQLWCYAHKSTLDIVQRTQSSILRGITGAPWYVRNCDLHKDLKVTPIIQDTRTFLERYQNKLENHPNPLARDLTRRARTTRLKRKDFPQLPPL